MMDNKKKNKKKKMIKNKIKNECAFLYYIGYNKDEKQTKEFLCYVMTDNISCPTHKLPLRKLNTRLTVLQFIVT